MKDGTLVALLAVFTKPECLKDLNFSEQVLGCLAMITLRSPSNSISIINGGNNTIDTVIQCMNYHMISHLSSANEGSTTVRFQASPAGMLRQGCLFFRNIAARCPAEKVEILKSTNIETVLKQVGECSGQEECAVKQ